MSYFDASELRASRVFDSSHATSSELRSGEVLNWREGINNAYSPSRSMTLNDFGSLGFDGI
jgi:hypothetical protein